MGGEYELNVNLLRKVELNRISEWVWGCQTRVISSAFFTASCWLVVGCISGMWGLWLQSWLKASLPDCPSPGSYHSASPSRYVWPEQLNGCLQQAVTLLVGLAPLWGWYGCCREGWGARGQTTWNQGGMAVIYTAWLRCKPLSFAGVKPLSWNSPLTKTFFSQTSSAQTCAYLCWVSLSRE